MNLFSMVSNRPLNYGDTDGNEGKDLTQEQIDFFAEQLRAEKKDLSEKEIDDVIGSYLKKKASTQKNMPKQSSFSLASRLAQPPITER